MADNTNNQQSQFNHGDILGSISGDVSQIRGNTSDIRDNTEILKSIDRNIALILQNSGSWSQQDARSRIYDTIQNNTDRSYDNDPYRRRPGNNRDRDRNRNFTDGVRQAEGFLDSFFEELEREMFGSGFKQAAQQSMRDFANALGVELRDVPGLFGRTLAQEFKQTQLGKKISERIQESMDNTIHNSIDRMRRGIDEYYTRVTGSGRMAEDRAADEQRRWSEVMDQIERNFANRRTDVTNDPTPGGSDDSPNGNDQAAEDRAADEQRRWSEVMDDKLSYLYPIYTTLGLVNDGVQIMVDYWTSGDDTMSAILDIYHQTSDQISEQNNSFIESMLSQGLGGAGGSGDISSIISQIGPEVAPILEEFAAGGLSAGAALSGIAAAAGPVVLGFVAIEAASWLLDKAIESFKACFKPLQDSFEDLTESLHKASNRFFESERKKIANETDRLREDVKVMIETPFQIMEKAAEEWYAAWDNNLKTINATQGYTKADLQNLMASYSSRLQQEGLANVISSADISNSLAKVLESGLTGVAAEEFAYLATKLSNAVPTEDFFSYADTYASIAAMQMSLGKSQSEALSMANKQLTQFASNLVYSSRELAGGFASGLKDASRLLESSVKIANTAGVADSSMISSTLTAISAVVGSVAPDLAANITDAIIDAALGGNTDELVALRSQAGTGAANTAFLNAFARDPQKVLQTLFGNLSNMQRMSPDNFMEVAESLASTFGLSIGSFTRIDFDAVSSAISNMNTGLNSINDNLKLLQEGQTTTTAEQLRMQKVNEMILNEGLSYVLDNEAARSIQEHMWQQEIAAEIMETEYSVDLTGKALEFLSGIKETVVNLFNLLNPFSWIKKVLSVTETYSESFALKSDIKAMLEAGKVGQGNKSSLYNLTTYDVDKLTNKPGNLLEMMGGRSAYNTVSSLGSLFRSVTSPLGLESNNSILGILGQVVKGGYSTGPANSGITSQYDWNYITKGLHDAIGNNPFGEGVYTPGKSAAVATAVSTGTSSQTQVTNKNTANLTDYLDTMESYVMDNQSFKDWLKSAKDFGISDVKSAIAPYDLTMTDLESKYQEYEAAQTSEYNYNQDEIQQDFWNRVEKFLEEDFPALFDELIEKLDRQIELMENIDLTLTNFFDSWMHDWLQKAWPVDWLQNAWQTNWLDEAWNTNWLEKAWSKDWIQDAWYKTWIENAWNRDWLENAWYKAWLEDAWQNSWLTEAWGEQWLQQAWQSNWLDKAWQSNWLDKAWQENWLNKAWQTDWLDKAWQSNWLDKAWHQDWLEKAWQQNWLDKAWYKTWIQENWKVAWLQKAWQQDWLKQAWQENWLNKAWYKTWIEDNWKQLWVNKTWTKEWVKETWKKEWVEQTFKKQFVNDVIKVLWGNRWWEFFNIFKDRFGGITTKDTKDGSNGKTSIDTSGIYKIYEAETGKAASKALNDVKKEESTSTGDAVLALAKQLTKNSVELRDPQVQTNVLLSQILIVLEALMQAENVAGGASLATTLAALGMGVIQPNTANNAGTSNNRLTTL